MGFDYQTLYIVCFYAVVLLLFVAELVKPKRVLQHSIAVRWLNNIGLNLLSGYLLKLVIPLAAIELAMWLEDRGYGLFNWLEVPVWLAVLFAVLLLDLVAYVLHRLYHRYLILWRCHLVHHTDLDVDFTTHVRHHPFEFLISLMVSLFVICLLGLPALGVFIYAVIAHGVSFFAHANVSLPAKLDRQLRYLVVTPDMHRIHHSVDKPETNSNYAIVFSCWDRLFNSYLEQPKKGHLGMTLGLDRFRDRRDLFIDRMLLLPFSKLASQRAKPVDEITE